MIIPSHHVYATYDTLCDAVATYIYTNIRHGLQKTGTFVLGCATGSTPEGVYERLVQTISKDKPDLSGLSTVNLDEYFPIQRTDPQSYYQFMMKRLWEPLADLSLGFVPDRQADIPRGDAPDPVAECARYEARIRALGGVDLQLLGIGVNGHVGFNEPGSPTDSRTRLVDLTESTIRANSRFYQGDKTKVPRQAITMGIGTILDARELLILASGKNKAPILDKLAALPHAIPDIPASALVGHPHISFFLDQDAAHSV